LKTTTKMNSIELRTAIVRELPDGEVRDMVKSPSLCLLYMPIEIVGAVVRSTLLPGRSTTMTEIMSSVIAYYNNNHAQDVLSNCPIGRLDDAVEAYIGMMKLHLDLLEYLDESAFYPDGFTKGLTKEEFAEAARKDVEEFAAIRKTNFDELRASFEKIKSDIKDLIEGKIMPDDVLLEMSEDLPKM